MRDQAVNRPRGFWGRLLRKPLATAALVVIVVMVLACILAPLLAPYGPEEQDLANAYSGPSSRHWLGSGQLGLDVLSRLLYGGRVTLIGVVISVSVYATVGVTAGLAAGYLGGFVDRAVLRVAELVYAIPAIVILLVVLAIFPNDERWAMLALGLLGAPALARVVRSVTRSVRQELYVRAAEISGLSTPVIMRRHLLPRLAGPVIVQISLFGGAAIALETGLGFLGLGVTSATWGTLVAEASKNLGVQPWLLVPSGGTIIVFILALGVLGDGVRDAIVERWAPPAAARRSEHAALPTRPTVPSPADEPVGRAAAHGQPLLAVRDLSVTFPIGGVPTPVVSGVSFDVWPGEIVGVVGESGCGKSVTAASVLGLLTAGGRVASGSIEFDGVDLANAPHERLRQIRGGRIGWVSQDPIASLDPSFTVGSQVAEAIRAHGGVSRRNARRRVLELFDAVRLPDPERIAGSYPHQLSGGMAQRVGIAAALAADPVLVIADEPTTALDVTVQAEILDVLRSLRDRGAAVVLVTHDWGVLADLCERALVMYAGQIVESATVAELVVAPRHPYTSALLGANPHGAEPGQPLPQIDGVVPPPTEWPLGCHFAARCPLAVDACREAPIAMLTETSRQTRCLRADDVGARPELAGAVR